jgi:hypothetical protein
MAKKNDAKSSAETVGNAARAEQEYSAKSILIPRMKIGRFELWLVGLTPLVVNPFDIKTRGQMLAKHMGAAKQARAVKNPEEDVNARARTYMTPDGRFGFPTVSFKAAAVSGCRSVQAKMTETRQAFFVRDALTPIYGGDPVAWESMVRNANGQPDIRFRPVFEEWAVCLTIEHDAGLISQAQIVNLFERGGYGVGVGDWRPEKSASGWCGRFRLGDERDAKAFAARIPSTKTIKVELSDETLALLGDDAVAVEPSSDDPPPKVATKKSNGHVVA